MFIVLASGRSLRPLAVSVLWAGGNFFSVFERAVAPEANGISRIERLARVELWRNNNSARLGDFAPARTIDCARDKWLSQNIVGRSSLDLPIK